MYQAPIEDSVGASQAADREGNLASARSKSHLHTNGNADALDGNKGQTLHANGSNGFLPPSQANQGNGSAAWDEFADDGASFFDDTPKKATPSQHHLLPDPTTAGAPEAANQTNTRAHHAGFAGVVQAHAPADESAPAWRPESSSNENQASPFTAMSSQEPIEWDEGHEVHRSNTLKESRDLADAVPCRLHLPFYYYLRGNQCSPVGENRRSTRHMAWSD